MGDLNKKIVALLCAATSLGVAFFCGCGESAVENTPSEPSGQIKPEQSDSQPEEDGKTDNTDETEEKYKPTSKNDILSLAGEILGRMEDGKNFTMKTGDSEKRFDSKNGVDKSEEIIDGKAQKYTETSNGQNFQYAFDLSDKKWHKTFAKSGVASQIAEFTDPIYDIHWGEYDLDDIVIVSKDLTATMTFEVDKTKATGFTLVQNGVETKISAVGATVVNLPASENVSDETQPPVTDPEKDPEEDEYIYTDEGGWNTTLLIDTLDEWLRETDYITKKWSANIFKKVLSVTPTESDLKIDTLTYTNGKPNFLSLHFREKFYKEITEEGYHRTKKELLDKLNPTVDDPDAYCYLVLNARISGFYSSEDDNYSEFKEELDRLTECVFDRLATIGIQKVSAKIAGEPNTEYKNAKIKFALKDEPKMTAAAYYIGASKRFHLYYIVENNGKNQFLEFTVFSSIEGVENANELVAIFEDHPGLWLVQDLKVTDIVLSENFESNLTKQ